MPDHKRGPALPATATWIDAICARFDSYLLSRHERPVRRDSIPAIIIATSAYALVFYGAALLLAIGSGFFVNFVTSPHMLCAAFAMAWVLGWIRWGLLRLPSIFGAACACFNDERQFLRLANSAIVRLSSRAGAFSVSLAIFLGGFAVTAYGLFRAEDTHRFHLLPPIWYQGSPAAHLVILSVIGIGCSLALGTALWLFAVNARFLWQIRSLEVLPMPGVLIARLRLISNFYLTAAFSWFIGVAVLAYYFAGPLTPLSILVLSVTSSFGLVTALAPQLVFRRFIIEAASHVAERFAAIYKRDFSSIDSKSLSQVTSMIQASQPVSTWIISPKDLFLLMVGQLAPFAKYFFGP